MIRAYGNGRKNNTYFVSIFFTSSNTFDRYKKKKQTSTVNVK